ncbi:MAG: dTMP kinase [Mycoplasmataceae bacterium]|jgi:dTMP kinase|nr:dTMP kinase [Mycoplasmataceae bacterium]
MKNTLNRKGLFITFEGVDGSGKSSITKLVYDELKKNNFNVVVTREPGGTNNAIAEDIRNILLNKDTYKIDYRAEALLFAASRAQHVNDFIKPNLDNGNIVLCDRYIDSSLVYQGIGRNLGINNILKINDFAMNDIIPNKTFVLMVEPKITMERILKNKSREKNRLDKEKELQKQVYNGYEYLINSDKNNRLVRIDATKDIGTVFKNVMKLIKKYIDSHYNGKYIK